MPAPPPDRSTRLLIELLRAGERVRFYAAGCSMWPAIPSRSLLEVRPAETRELRAGQLGAFERGGRVVVHRVLCVTAEHVELAGDALAQSDGPVPWARMLGRAYVLDRRRLSWQLPRLGHVRSVLRALGRRLRLA